MIPGDTKRILFLQGHPSPFWGELADRLVESGCQVHKINFCLADRVFWGRRHAETYGGPFETWENWLSRYLERHRITDVLYYADRFPYHVVARKLCEEQGLRPWAMEFGYLRPDWLTFEPGGTGGFSRFDRSPEGLSKAAAGHPRPDLRMRFAHRFATEAICEVAFGLLSTAGRPFYPHYKSDRRFWPVADYLSWLPKLMTASFAAAHADRVAQRFLAPDASAFNLVAMQIASDYQIRDNSDFASPMAFLETVLNSFMAHAPADRHLLIKLHPLDSGLEMSRRRCQRLLDRIGLAGRAAIIQGAELGPLIDACEGVITVNSTVGVHALRQKKAVIACGRAIYDIPGLTHQRGIDTFWKDPEPVSGPALETFLRALTRIQVKGSFFEPEGRKAAVSEIAARLTQNTALPRLDYPVAVADQQGRAQHKEPKPQPEWV